MATQLAEVHRDKASYSGDNMLEGLAHELNVWQRLNPRHNTFRALSKRLNGAPTPQTISRIAYRETKQPRMTTVVLLFYALGFSIRVER